MEFKSVHNTAIISKNSRIRHPQHFEIGEHSILDDFCYISTKVKIGKCSHIAAGCHIGGGANQMFILGDYSSLSSGVKVWCASDDFFNDVVSIIPLCVDNPKKNFITGDVVLTNYNAVGSNSVIMPGNVIPEGTVIGALSFVPARSQLEPWAVYAGVPIRLIRYRNKQEVMKQIQYLERAIKND